jgi:hypothetical protein
MNKKLTLEEIKLKLPSYIKIKEESYISYKKECIFIDEEYGEFKSTPRNILRGSQHPSKRNKKLSNSKILPIEEIRSKLPFYIQIKEETYKGSSKESTFIDEEYGEFKSTTYNILYKNANHPQRSLKILKIKKTTPIEAVKEKIKNIHGDNIRIIEESYISRSKKADFFDIKYGKFSKIVNAVIRGERHSNFSNEQKSKEKTTPLEIVKEKIKNIHGDNVRIIEESYISSSKNATFIDSEYGKFSNFPYRVIKGKRHPKFNIKNGNLKKIIPIEFIIKNLPEGVEIDKNTYKGIHEKAIFIDKIYNQWLARPYNVIINKTRHPKYFKKNISLEQKSIEFWIKQDLSIKTEECKKFYKTINNKRNKYEVDIFLPDYNFGIEYNGLYWHSDKYRKKLAHLKKREFFNNLDIDLIQINSDEWLYKRDIVKSIILAKLGKIENKLQARKLTIKTIENKNAQNFLNKNHLMGAYRAAKYIGLYNKEELISLIGYKKLKNNGIDISRFCNKINTSVAGGLSKLLKYIENLENPNYITYFVDLRYGTGRSVENLGYKLENISLSFKWANRKNETFNRLYCRANMDERKLTEKEYAIEKGLFKIYDAGQAKFIKTIKT